MDGTDDMGGDGSGDDDDDNDDDHAPIISPPASEDEDEDTATEREEGSSTYFSANASPEEPRPGPSAPSSRILDGDKTPVLKPPQDYFTIHPVRSDSVNWNSPGSHPKRISLTPMDRSPTLYHQTSKSMINLLSSPPRDLSIIDEETKGKGRATDTASPVVAGEASVPPEGSRIQRRRSLPKIGRAHV